jgi:selenium metabolism protein YedF
METIDARNLPCPEPVVMTKKGLEKSADGKLTVIVNSGEANENVQRFAQSQGCRVKAEEKNGVFTLEISRTDVAAVREVAADKRGAGTTTVMMIASDQLGSGDEALGQLLIAAFINTLPEASSKPAKMLFINRGVMLTTEGSRVLDSLQKLEQAGVQIFSCGTCLNHYQLKEKLKVGKVTNMYDTVDSLLSAEKVVRI